jgi:ubiquinone/menaquinone biosynthesis C-methylase UbiE
VETRKDHWEKIYATKQPHEVSWTQDQPTASLQFIRGFNLPKSAAVIDVGGGESRLVDFLINEGFENITVLDISEQALNRTRERLGDKARRVKWIVSDITEFTPDATYDLWHDRATFHFLTTDDQITRYLHTVRRAVAPQGFLTIGTFSTDGPTKCSGLPVKQYDEQTLAAQLKHGFVKLRCLTDDHITPFNTFQNFLFCSFRRSGLN